MQRAQQTSIERPQQGNERVLVTGVTSIHGWPIYQRLAASLPPERLFGVCPPKTKSSTPRHVGPLCITDKAALERLRDRVRPDVVIHAAGVCDLDLCEERPAWAQALNVEGAANIAEVFRESRIVHISTDLVFSGETAPEKGYAETDPTDPVSVVGRTFVLAERQISAVPGHTIVRLALPLGDSFDGTKGALDWIRGRLRRGRPATLFYDEYRSCIDCEELARVVEALLSTRSFGLYHLGGPVPISLYDVGLRVLAEGGYERHLLRRSSRFEEIDGPPRVGNVSLDSSRIEGLIGSRIASCVRRRNPSLPPDGDVVTPAIGPQA